MNKFSFSFLLLLLLTNLAFSQGQTVKKDFNKDGVLDKVIIVEDGGSSFSTKFINYLDGKRKKWTKFDILYSENSFISVCKVPPILGKIGGVTMGNMLFNRKDSIEPSLKWIIDVTISKGTKYNPIWITGEPQIPDSYYALIEGHKYKDFLKSGIDSTILNSKTANSDYYWIDYSTYGHHFNTRSRDRRRDSTIIGDFKITKVDSATWIYNTANGVLLKKFDKYSWLFISDSYAGTGDQKLRWNSIDNVYMFKDLIFVLHSYFSGASNFLIIINPTTGNICSLDEDLGFGAVENIKINNDSVDFKTTFGDQTLTESKINELFKKQLEK